MSKELSARLSAIQSELKSPKGQENKFGGFKYRNCEDILESLKKTSIEGLCVLVSDDITVVGDRIYVKATATITDGENSISSTGFAREALSKKGMDESQITGAASSYARKYALNGLFMIDDSKDADHDNGWTVENCVARYTAMSQAEQEEAWQSIDPKIQKVIIEKIG